MMIIRFAWKKENILFHFLYREEIVNTLEKHNVLIIGKLFF